MSTPIDPYLANQFGKLNVPADPKAQFDMARTLLGSSFVGTLDYLLNNALDKVENPKPSKPYIRDNEFSREDRYFRDAFEKMDPTSKEAVRKLLFRSLSGLFFSLLVDVDQFRFGELSISLLPKTDSPNSIELTSPTEELHDELHEWIYQFSKFREKLVEREDTKAGVSYRLI
jgi:hypothetical protein